MGEIRVNGREQTVEVIGPHWHPADREVITVKSDGVIRYFLMKDRADQSDFETKILGPGESLEIEPGYIHRFDNPASDIVDVEIEMNIFRHGAQSNIDDGTNESANKDDGSKQQHPIDDAVVAIAENVGVLGVCCVGDVFAVVMVYDHYCVLLVGCWLLHV